jgi:alpha-mannosidase
MMKEKKLYMIGNAHIDPVWLWRWQEGFHEVKASFRSALDRMKEYEDFVFVSSSAAFYEWVEQSDPAMFAEIKQRVCEGRWGIVGGWWIQPDCNLPGGESFVRQGLYGQRYFKEKLGVTAVVGYNVDSFGHHGMLPQLLKKSGMDYYIFMRPRPNEKGLPGRLFWWEADDGSQILTFRLPFEYCSPGQDIEKHVRRCAAELRTPFDESMCFYGVGNHGGGPTKANLESIRRLDGDPDLPQLLFSTPAQFFADVQSKGLCFPVVHRDLQHHASGCYAVHSGIKRWNRQAENLLLTAEKLSTVAQRLTGQPYPNGLDQAWKNVLFNQFHDILAGTSLESAYEDARNSYGEAMAIADRALNYAVQAVAWNIHIEPEEGMKPIIVFNPHAWPSKVSVEVEFGRFTAENRLLDDEGRLVPVQLVQPEATANGRNRLCFVADLPALGYRVYRVVSLATTADVPTIQASDHLLENGRFRLEIDPETGTIASLYDKKFQVELFEGPAADPVVIEDLSDTWGHNVFRFDHVTGVFAAFSVKLVEHGPVKSVIRVSSEYGASVLVQDFTMYREKDQIEVRVILDWREHFKVLKLRFPLRLSFTNATFEIPYGHIERGANGEEEPGQSWIDLSGISKDSGEPYGLSILNDGKYSFDVTQANAGMTVIRSPIYAHHIPAVPQPKRLYSFIDQGVQRFTYTLLPHEGDWRQAGAVRRAAELNQRPIPLIGTYHEGPLPQHDSYLSVDRDNIIITVLKKAEDNDDLILRCYESATEATLATIRLPLWQREIKAHFGPCEIKTFRIPQDETQPVVESNFLEWPE